MRVGVCLSAREVRTIQQLLGLLQTHLESAIESATLPDGSLMEGETDEMKADIEADRRDWRRAEEIVAKLERARR